MMIIIGLGLLSTNNNEGIVIEGNSNIPFIHNTYAYSSSEITSGAATTNTTTLLTENATTMTENAKTTATTSPAAATNMTKLPIDNRTAANTTTLPTENKTANILYNYEPHMTFTGENYSEIGNRDELKLTNFTIATWFKTADPNPLIISNASRQTILNKGGLGSESPGENTNYNFYIRNSDGKLRSEFENLNGTRYRVKSIAPLNDTQWHYAVATYDGATYILYVDGIEQAREITDGAVPDNTGNQPLRLGADARELSDYFTGNIDEVRIWNRALTPSEVKQAYEEGVFNTNGQVVYLSFESPLSLNQTSAVNQTQSLNQSLPSIIR